MDESELKELRNEIAELKISIARIKNDMYECMIKLSEIYKKVEGKHG